MSTFKARIEDYVGSVGDDTFLGDALTDTTAEVLRALPVDKLGYFSAETADQTSNGININNHKVLSVVRERGTDNEYVECRQVSPSYFRKAQDTKSMFAGTVESPVFTVKNSKVFVFPAPAGDGLNAVRLETVQFPAVSAGQTYIDETGTTEFTQTIQDVVVLGATAKACQYLMARVKDSLPSEPVLVLSNITVPTTPGNPSISYSNAVLGNSVGAAVDSVANAVDSVAGAVDGYTGINQTAATTSNASPGQSSATTNVVAGSSAASTTVSAGSAGASSSVTAVDSTGSSASAYTGPATTASGAGTDLLQLTSGTIGNATDQVQYDKWWDVLADYIETEEDDELAQIQINKIRSYIEAFQVEVSNARNAMEATINDARLSTDASIANMRKDLEASSRTVGLAVEEAIANARETTSANAQAARLAVDQAVSNSREATTANTQSVRLGVEQGISNAKSITEVNITNARADLDAELASINSRTQASIAKMRESTGASIAKMQASTNASIAKMRESTGASVARMQQSTNVNIQNASSALEAAISDYQLEVDKFRADIQRYTSEVQAAVGEYTGDIQKYTAQVDRYTKEYSWYQDQYARFETKFKESLQIVVQN